MKISYFKQKFGKIILTAALVIPILSFEAAMPLTSNAQDVFNWAMNETLQTPDPCLRAGSFAPSFLVNVYDSLLRVGWYDEKSGAFDPYIPWVATSWTQENEGKTWVFTIRKGIKFHDGRELTAEDVAFSMDRELALGGTRSSIWSPFIDEGGSVVVDKYKIAFNLKSRCGFWPATLVQLFILNKNLVMENSQKGEHGQFGDYGKAYLAENEAGSGPYIAKSIKRAEKVILEKFDDYWAGWPEGNVFERVVMHSIPEEATLKGMAKTGQLDMIAEGMSPEAYNDLKGVPGIIVKTYPANKNFESTIHTQKPPTDDIWVRKAITYAIDYDAAMTGIIKGERSTGPIPPFLPGNNKTIYTPRRDLKVAKQYLEKSKYSADELKKMKFIMTTGPFEQHKKAATLVKSNLADIGINVDLNIIAWPQVVAQLSNIETAPNISFAWNAAFYIDPNIFLGYEYTKNAWGTRRGSAYYTDPIVEELLAKAAAEGKAEDRYRYYEKAEIIIAEQAPAIWWGTGNFYMVIKEGIKGFKYNVGKSMPYWFRNLYK